MQVIAIDPGTEVSGVVVWDGKQVQFAGTPGNKILLQWLESGWQSFPDAHLAIEQVRSYGMRVGAETFETCEWCGRFEQAWKMSTGNNVEFIPRREVYKSVLAKGVGDDSQIMHTLLAMYGPKPTKKKPNPIYGGYKLAGHQWQALGLGYTYIDRNGGGE